MERSVLGTLSAAARRPRAAGGRSQPADARLSCIQCVSSSGRSRTIAGSCSAVSFCEQPPLNLIKSIELSGCYIVDDDFILVTRWEKSEVATDGDPIANLARSYLHDSMSTVAEIRAGSGQQGPVSRRQRAPEPRRRRHLCDAELLRSGAARTADVAKRAEEARRPQIAFKYAENSGQMQPIREQAGTFADSIKLWSGA